MRNKTKVDLVIFICALIASCSLFLIEEDYGQIISFVFLIIALGISWFRREIYDLLGR